FRSRAAPTTQGWRQCQLKNRASPPPRASLSRGLRALSPARADPLTGMLRRRQVCCVLTELLRGRQEPRPRRQKDTVGVGPSSTRRAAPPQSSRVRTARASPLEGAPRGARPADSGTFLTPELSVHPLTATSISPRTRLGPRGVPAGL